MKPENPFISIIVPAYNAADFLVDALDCVRDQRYPELEVILVDDGSTDDTPRVAAAFGDRVRYARQDNQGPGSARNHGLRLAQGNLIAFLDADDLWPPNTLNLLAGYLVDHPRTEFVMGRVQYMRQVPAALGRSQFEHFDQPVLGVNLGAGLFRRTVFDKVGSFDATVRVGEDVDWFMRVREAGISMSFLDQVTLLYRRHDRNLTYDRAASLNAFARVLKRSLDRRRRSGAGVSLAPLLGVQVKS